MQSKQGYLYFIFFPLFFVASVFIPLNSFSQKAISPDSAISQASSLLYSDPYKVKIFVDSVLADNSHEISSKTKARAYGIIAKSKYLLGDYPAALEYALKYLKTIRNVGNELNLEADALNILGVIYQAQNDYSKSIGYYSESLKLREQMNDKKLIAASLGNIGMVYQEMKKPEQSIEYLLKAKKILESLNNKYELANTLNSLSNIYLDAGQLDSAYKSINVAIKIKTEIGDSSTLTVAYCNLAGILSDMKRINEAELFYRKSIALANQLGNKNTLRSAYDYFSEFFEKTGRPDSALHYSRLFKILNESLFNSEKASQIAELQIKFNNEQKEKLRDLEQKAKDAEQKVKVNRLQFLIASSIIILLITLLFSFFI
ncbi:MAG: tetratricopeptide repeat protein, partial [Bacteroidia bacterium]